MPQRSINESSRYDSPTNHHAPLPPPSRPTTFYLDAQAVLDGTTCERLSKGSRWMAMRYAMLRWGIMCGTIDPHKRPSACNPSDGLTKCLVGKPFMNARARLLGHPLPHLEPAD